ncbi:hypothetical protein XA26_12250 [Mycolicibacterium fortuitum]|uniref:Uncharacterized protein n=1 Tax=Mycolicibacterium fortuitum TaxID=1766 RepID=A0A0N9X9F1_MYCFO|nr:hypothetical protein XA26_12250 [Mycolicibacterium fortuitum]
MRTGNRKARLLGDSWVKAPTFQVTVVTIMSSQLIAALPQPIWRRRSDSELC